MNYWIRAYNHKNFRVADFIRDYGYIDWHTRQHFEVGDVLFLYATAPQSRITFMMEVTRVGMTWHETTDDRAYYLARTSYDRWLNGRDAMRFARYAFLKELHSPALGFHELMAHGLGGAPRSPRRLGPEVTDYVMNHLE